ncbi:hypothetical protein AALP_AA1G289000 [Arabis alpina]|uniref:DUF7733 domain-containing protein n=1 Tax=Arabis alpina TaxID=50452 RepID=A0A087HRC4_ARAAL|nr:hypothetical protein AALP_AA1G289000 [Arabis alpina]
MVDEILRQMKENEVEHDNILTANNVLKAYATRVPDVEAMENFWMHGNRRRNLAVVVVIVIKTDSNKKAHIIPVSVHWLQQGHRVKPSHLPDSNKFSKALEVEDSVTVNHVLKVMAIVGNIDMMETFKTRVDVKGIKLEGDTIVAMAKSYVRVGSIEKAIEMYGDLKGSKREVYRLWNEYKNDGSRTKNSILLEPDGLYRAMISTLLKLDDVQGAEKIHEEWKPISLKVYMRIPGVSLAVGPRTDVDKTSTSSGEKGRWSGMTAAGGGGLMGSLRVIELQLVAFILVFSASGLVPILDMLFPAFATVYLIAISRLAFPSHGVSNGSPEVFHGSKLFRVYVVSGTTIGLFLPLAYVLGGFARGDDHACGGSLSSLLGLKMFGSTNLYQSMPHPMRLHGSGLDGT